MVAIPNIATVETLPYIHIHIYVRLTLGFVGFYVRAHLAQHNIYRLTQLFDKIHVA